MQKYAFLTDLKKETTIPTENNLKPQNDSAPKVDLKKENAIPTENNVRSS